MRHFITITLEILLVLIVLLLIVCGAWLTYLNTRIDTIENQEIADVPGEIIAVNYNNLQANLHVQVFDDVDNDIPILLLHQFDPAGNLSLQAFALELSRSRPVILPDLLGSGFSERVTESGEHYTLRGQVALLVSLLDNLNIERVDIIGHAYGGAIAAQFALDYPGRVEHLVLISADIYERDFNLIEQARTLPAGIGRAITFLTQGGGSTANISETDDCINCPVDLRGDYLSIADTTDALMAIYTTEDESQLAENITSLTVPVAVIWGNDDMVIPFDYGQRLIDAIQPQETAIIMDGGHYPFEVNMDEVLEAISHFLSE